MLDSKTIETLSVNAVKNSIVTSEFLDQYISENDKEPSWDGAVYIYRNKNKKKDNLKGRMPVQVKGVQCDDYSKENISFSMSKSDLVNYLYDGGCVLFVVYIGNNGLTNKIYYVELTPLKLRKLLEGAKEQDSKTVHLKEFPSDSNKKATIFLNCLQNCQKQSSFVEGKLFSLEELVKQGVLENLVIPFSGVGIKDPQMALVKNEVYLYAKIKGSSIPQPIKMIPEGSFTSQVLDAEVTIDNRMFYSECTVNKSADSVTYCFGSSFEMKFGEQEQTCKINYKNSTKIRVLANDLDFLLSYIDKGYFKLNGAEFSFDYDGADFSNFDIEEERKHLELAKKIVKVLDLLGCADDIDIDDMEAKDWRNMERLITAFIDKKPVSGLNKDLSPVSCMKVGKLKLALYLKEIEETEEYEIYDFFKTDVSVSIEDEDGKSLPVSPYCILSTDNFLDISNMNFDVLLPSFQKIEHHSETFSIANTFLLKLLAAYDKSESEELKSKIIKVCDDFSDWILKATDEELDYEIKTLNRLQTIKRYRDFTIDEISTLYKLIEDSNTSEMCIVGAYLLLGQQCAAEIHFSRLTDEEQKYFKDFPIYSFWKLEEESNG